MALYWDRFDGDSTRCVNLVWIVIRYKILICDMQNNPIICDPGTGYMKMGFAGDNFPKATFASLVGRPMLRFEESLGE